MRHMKKAVAAAVFSVLSMLHGPAFGQTSSLISANSTGFQETTGQNVNLFDYSNPFFQPLGTNGRTCASCHVPGTSWGLSASEVQSRFTSTNGLDPLFRTVDGSNSPNANVSTYAARQAAYSMIMKRGTIRVGLPIPSYGQFTLSAVQDPYGFASATQLSLFRKPLPATNLRFLSTVMWDGRFSFVPTGAATVAIGAPASQNQAGLFTNLIHQANDAINGHGQAKTPASSSVLSSIVNFELNTSTAQVMDNKAGLLDYPNVNGGPVYLSQAPFYIGYNDVIGRDPTGRPFSPVTMTIYNNWLSSTNPAQASIARGEQIFNLNTFNITGVAGLNDALNIPVLVASCVACHDTPNVGNQSTELYFNTGVVAATRRTSDLPLYTLKNTSTGATQQVTDPGRALISGLWSDIGKFKPPTLRGMAGRAPYFHDGSATDLTAVVNFYNTRFNINYTPQQITDLVAFLQTL